MRQTRLHPVSRILVSALALLSVLEEICLAWTVLQDRRVLDALIMLAGLPFAALMCSLALRDDLPRWLSRRLPGGHAD